MLRISQTGMKTVIHRFRQNKIIRNKVFGIVVTLFCVTIAYILMYQTRGGYFLTNDDSGMMKTVSGYATGVPTSYHQFICTAMGVFFKTLYVINPDVSWYSYVYVGSVIVCVSTILYVMIRSVRLKNKRMQAMGVCAVIMVVTAITVFGFYYISWTETSVFFGTAALVLMFSLTHSHSKKMMAAICAVSGVFVILSAMIRFHSFLCLLPYFFLISVYVIIKNAKKHSIKTHAALLAALFMLSVGLYQYNVMDKEYKFTHYEAVSRSDFNSYRVQFSDYPVAPYEGNEDFYSSIGWDKDFYDMARQWMFMDRRFNTENLRKIAEMSHTQTAAVSSEKTKEAQKENIFEQFITMTDGDIQWKLLTIAVIGFACLGLILIVWCLIKNRRKYMVDSLMLFGVNLLAISECLYLITQGRYMFRVFLCPAVPALCISMMILFRNLSETDRLVQAEKANASLKKMEALVLIGVTVIGFFYFVNNTYQNIKGKDKYFRNYSNNLTQEVERFCVTNKDNLYIHNGVAVNDTRLFLDMSLRGCSNNLLFWGGTGVFSNAYYDTVGRFGYDEFYSDNLLDDNVYFICGDSSMDDTVFVHYMQSAYGEDIQCKQVYNIKNLAFVYKFTRG